MSIIDMSKRWQALMSAFKFLPNDDTYKNLTVCYQEPHRHYHTLTHLKSCFYHLDAYASSELCELDKSSLLEVELALWFHDVIYQPRSLTNEKDSAAKLSDFLNYNASQETQSLRLIELVLVTQHPSIAQNKQQGILLDIDLSILLDIDLSILGADSACYDEFELAIKQEYKWVPDELYKEKRSCLLNSLLRHKHVFQSEYFTVHLEHQAQCNIKRTINKLSLS